MRVIAISGSPRKGGNTEIACQTALQPIQDAGIDTEFVSLAGKEIGPCIACGRCAQGQGCLAHKDDFDPIYQQVKNADGLILASPVYFGCATGPICNVMHRLGYASRRSDNFLARKAGGAIAVARRAGHNATFAQLSMFFAINDMIQVGSTYWNVALACQPGEINQDTEAIQTLTHFGENLAWLLTKIHS
ncbi:MAG: flavodoxin family protein [Sedimentisphaerales bacterium]|nr:flavodoxin family protein [Sedimentisphaerales bacterium]